jgi:CRISPR/Cas system CMR subunit Cmr4 (Cas7 group RAMP superfamily)
MSDFTAPSLINWLIENLESAQDTEYVDLTEINKKYKAKATGLSVGNSLKKIQYLSFPGLLFSLLSELSNFYYCLK